MNIAKVKFFLQKYLRWISVSLFLGIMFLFMVFSKQDCEIIMPGSITAIDSKIIFATDHEKPRLHTTSVGVIRKPNYLLYAILGSFANNQISSLSSAELSLTNQEDYVMGRLYYQASYQNALITAYQYAGESDSSIKLDYQFLGVKVLYTPERKVLPIGTMVTKINEESLTINNFQRLITSNIASLSGPNLAKITFKERPKILFVADFKINSETSRPKFSINNEDRVGGPSGGFMQTLYIFLNLVKDPHLVAITKKYKVAGTGTIELDGKVGPIGGIEQKVHTVIKNKCQYFFLPRSNYLKHKVRLEEIAGNKITLLPIGSFKEGMDALCSIN